ncbi:MAG TPA: shikimate kinase [Lachnospiraceae bacterium]|nr:shikimate kinase [Lachnospiraceae bacterium]
MNYILTGLPGSGKSTIGVLLAKYLGYDFIDADLVIQKQERRLLSEIINEEGPDGFIAIENEIGAGIHAERAVIATGGSAVLGREAMENYKNGGKVIYLKIPFEEMKLRLSRNFRKRGVVLKAGQTLYSIYQERIPLYEKYADYTIEEINWNQEATLQNILDEIRR